MANKKQILLSSLYFIKFEQLVIVVDCICSTFLRGSILSCLTEIWLDYEIDGASSGKIIYSLSSQESRVPKFLSLANQMWAKFKWCCFMRPTVSKVEAVLSALHS